MATTKKLSFGLDKAGGAALILARIGAALLWIIAALAAVVWVVFLISPALVRRELRQCRPECRRRVHPQHQGRLVGLLL